MANAEAWTAGFGIGKKDSAKGKKDGKEGGLFARPSSYKHGGKVKKSGYAKVHKGERVLTASEAKSCAGSKGKKKSSRKRVASKR